MGFGRGKHLTFRLLHNHRTSWLVGGRLDWSPRKLSAPDGLISGPPRLKQTRHCHCLYDIRDPSAFVQGTINAFTAATARRPWPIVLSAEEREELHQEGLAILYRLSGTFETRREGYEQDGRFSGHAAMFLPRKLGDAWHRMHPDSHQQVHDPESGKRVWARPPDSFARGVTAEDPDRHQDHGLSKTRPATTSASACTGRSSPVPAASSCTRCMWPPWCIGSCSPARSLSSWGWLRRPYRVHACDREGEVNRGRCSRSSVRSRPASRPRLEADAEIAARVGRAVVAGVDGW